MHAALVLPHCWNAQGNRERAIAEILSVEQNYVDSLAYLVRVCKW